jgi:hypothetical protein
MSHENAYLRLPNLGADPDSLTISGFSGGAFVSNL